MYQKDTNKTHREKARWEPHNNVAYCLEQILEAASIKTAAVEPPASHFTNSSNTMNKTFEAVLKKQRLTYKQCSLIDSSTWTCQYWLTSKGLLASALYGHRMQP